MEQINRLKPMLLAIGFLFSISTQPILAQQFGGNRFGDPTATQEPERDSVQLEAELDTAHIVHFYAHNPTVTYPENDSLLTNYVHQFDPARRRTDDYFTLGMPATAAYRAVYHSEFRRGLDIGLKSFDLYHLRNSDIKFYQQTKTFTDLYYSAGAQTNGALTARFARNFANGINFTVDFRNIFNSIVNTNPQAARRLFEGTGINFDPARGRNRALGLGFWIHRPRYDAYLTFTANSVYQLDKGGVADDSIFTQNIDGQRFPSAAEVLTGATTNQQKFEYSYLQYLKLNRRDSTGSRTKRDFLATHQITFRDSRYRSSDPFASNQPSPSDSLFYGDLLNDARGLRFYLRELMLENVFNLSTSRLREDATRQVSTQNDWFELGISHQFHHINPELEKRNINNLILRGRWHLSPSDNLRIETYGHFNLLGYNLGDYRMSGSFYFNLKNIGSLHLKAVNQLYEPSFLQDNLVLTQRPFWQNDFKKTLETHLSGTLAVPRFGFEATAAYTLLNNYIYYDAKVRATQASTPLSILQLILNQNFKLGAFHLDNTISLQKTTEKFLRLPEVYSKNSLYVEGKVFKKVMLARVGFDLRYATSWFAPAYMPLTGQFYVQETAAVAAHPALDAFLSFRVQSFRFFVKMENLLGDYAGSRYYQIFRYPMPEASFRFGVRWRLLN